MADEQNAASGRLQPKKERNLGVAIAMGILFGILCFMAALIYLDSPPAMLLAGAGGAYFGFRFGSVALFLGVVTGMALLHSGLSLVKVLVDDADVSNHTIAQITAVGFSQDGRTLAAADVNSAIETWDVASSRIMRSSKLVRSRLGSNGLLFIPDGRVLTWGDNQKTTIWDAATGAPEGTLGTNRIIAVSLKGSALDSDLRLWDMGSGKLLRQFDKAGNAKSSAAFSADGRSLAVGGSGYSHSVRLWNVSDGKLLHILEGPCPEKSTACEVGYAPFSPDGRTVASSSSNEVCLWDVASGRLLHVLKFDLWGGPPAFSPDGRTLVVARGMNVRGEWKDTVSAEGSVTFWDVGSGKLLHEEAVAAFSIAFSPDGRTVAVGSAPYTVKLLDGKSGGTLRTLRGNAYWRRLKDDLRARLLTVNNVKLW